MVTKIRKRRTTAQLANAHRLTLAEACEQFGVARSTLQRRLISAGHKVADGQTYTILEVHHALAGALAAARLRVAKENGRRLKIANDEKEGQLVDRAWVGARLQRAAGELNAFRSRSESEHPMRFAAAAGDVALCRSVLRGIWSEIFTEYQALAKHFEE